MINARDLINNCAVVLQSCCPASASNKLHASIGNCNDTRDMAGGRLNLISLASNHESVDFARIPTCFFVDQSLSYFSLPDQIADGFAVFGEKCPGEIRGGRVLQDSISEVDEPVVITRVKLE